MFQMLRGDLRVSDGNGFLCAARRAMGALLLALLLPIGTFAYTVILRSGRAIEIPSQFTVTPLTLTYETAPGINVTLLMQSIDIAATERANHEPAGALLKRADASSNLTPAQTRTPRRELTQADIEAARRARAKSLQDYERRRQELGLPSLEESRRRTEEETKRLRAAAVQSELEEAQAETYWRERAGELIAAIATLDTQISYLQNSLAGTASYSDIGSYDFIGGFAPTFALRRPVARFPGVLRPGLTRGFGNTGTRGNFGGRVIAPRGFGFPSVAVIGVPFTNYNYSYDAADPVAQLYALEAERAGLQTRWQLLEEEARRAGVPPGWLRP